MPVPSFLGQIPHPRNRPGLFPYPIKTSDVFGQVKNPELDTAFLCNALVPQGPIVDEPYDGLSFVPTLLALTGKLGDDRMPVPALRGKGFSGFSGRVIKELVGG
jgi:hypothetical protein